MKKILHHIAAIILAGLFLVSFTGVKMILHHCLSCNTTEYSLTSHVVDCCDRHAVHHSSDLKASTCCTSDYGEDESCVLSNEKHQAIHCDNCCENEVVYVKNDYEVSSERQEIRVLPLAIAIIPSFLNEFQSSVYSNSITSFSESFQPPPKLVGKDFVLYSHQLKVS
jgi:hypothetical protein